MQIKKTSRSIQGKQLVRQKSIDTAVQSQKIVKSAIDNLGSLIACCETPEDKKKIQGAIANMSVVLLEMKR